MDESNTGDNAHTTHTPTFWAAPNIARAGYPVFPLVPGTKRPSVEGGFYAATTDHSHIAAWIEEGRGDHDIGLATGLPSGVVIIDADAQETYQEMQEKYGPPTVKTRRGGHWYFRHSRDGKVTSKKIKEGLDRKGDGGLVKTPPSQGRVWVNGIPDKGSLPRLPEELRGPRDSKARSRVSSSSEFTLD